MRVKKHGEARSPAIILWLVIAGVMIFTGCYNDEIGDAIVEENLLYLQGNDEGAPVPGNSGIVTASDIANDSVTLEWDEAVDDVTPQELLEYRVIYSTDSSFTTFLYANPEWTADLAGFAVNGLSEGTTYYFKVLVRDAGLAMASYQLVSATTEVTGGGTMFMYHTDDVEGNFLLQNSVVVTTPRTRANEFCAAQAVYTERGCSHAVAFISIGTGDDIAKMKNSPGDYGIPASWRIRSSKGNTVAGTWAALFNKLSDTLQDLGVATHHWWSGSTVDLTYDTEASCSGWTSNDNKRDGAEGSRNTKAYPDWIRNSMNNCNTPRQILCVCW